MREATPTRVGPASVALLCALGWAVPGAAHLWLRHWVKGLVFFAMLVSMFVIGLALHGRLFRFDLSDPLAALAFVAELSIGVAYLAARGWELGAGQVTAITFEYANTFLIVAGLLNLLVVLDARDIALGRKPAGPAPGPR